MWAKAQARRTIGKNLPQRFRSQLRFGGNASGMHMQMYRFSSSSPSPITAGARSVQCARKRTCVSRESAHQAG